MWPQVPTSKEVERSCEAKQELSQTNRSPLFEQDAKYGPASQWVGGAGRGRGRGARLLLTVRCPRLLPPIASSGGLASPCPRLLPHTTAIPPEMGAGMARLLLTEGTARPRLLCAHERCLADFVNLTISRPPSPSQSKIFHDKSDEKSGSWAHGKRGCPVRSTRVPLTCSR